MDLLKDTVPPFRYQISGKGRCIKLCYTINETKFSVWEELLEILKVEFISSKFHSYWICYLTYSPVGC